MKILVINWQDIRNPLGGGAEVHLHEIFKRLAARGHEVTLFCSGFRGAAREEVVDGIRIIRRGWRSTFNFVVPWYYGIRFAREAYDVVVDDINKIPFYTPLYVRKPLVAIVLHLFGRSIFSETNPAAALYVLGAERLAMVFYRRTLIAALSESTKRELLANGIPGERIHLVPGSVDHGLYRVLPQPGPGTTIGYLGRLKKYKSVEDLLAAFAIVLKEFPDTRLVIVGEGDARKGLEETAEELNIAAKVDFVGYVSEEEKVRLLNGMKFAVTPSAKEGWGLTVIEANACGVPVIASDVPGLRDSVIDGTTGLLYEYGNIEQLAEKMLLLLRDEHFRSRLSREAVVWSQNFDWDRSADAMLQVLNLAMGNRGSTKGKPG